jgi:predicted nuclease with TOPRIM domain
MEPFYIFERRKNIMDESRRMLEDELQSEIQNLSTLAPGSKEKTAAVDELSKLYRLKIEESKISEEAQARNDQISEQKKDRYIRLGTAAAELIIPLVFYGAWMKKGFEFEKTGTFTSTTFRGLFNRFKPTRY